MRAIKTHAEAQFVPDNTDAKYVVVVRDPKDALISSFFFADSIMPGLRSIGLTAWTDAFINGEVPFGLWAEHVASFWPWCERANVLLVTFGAMKSDLAQVVREVASLMQVTLRDEEVALVLERCSFAYMKAHEAKFEPPTPMINNDSVQLMRTGKKGEAAEHLSPDQLANVDRAMKAQLQAFGSDFPYDKYFG